MAVLFNINSTTAGLKAASVPNANAAYGIMGWFRLLSPIVQNVHLFALTKPSDFNNYEILYVNHAVSDLLWYRATKAGSASDFIGSTTILPYIWYAVAMVRIDTNFIRGYLGTTPTNIASDGAPWDAGDMTGRILPTELEIGPPINVGTTIRNDIEFCGVRSFTGEPTLAQIKSELAFQRYVDNTNLISNWTLNEFQSYDDYGPANVDLIASGDLRIIEDVYDPVPFTEWQYGKPVSDVSDGAWLNESASNVNLFQSIDDPDPAAPSDSDWMRTPADPTAETAKFGVSDVGTPTPGPWSFVVRHKKDL